MIEFRSIKYSSGNKQFDYSFKSSCSITGIFGPSGAGKTTMFNLLSGLSTPDSGEIILNRVTLYDNKKKLNISAKNRNIGYVFQENLLFPHLTVQKNLLFSSLYLKKNKRKQSILLQDVIELLDLNDLLYQMPRQLSGGEKQRVAIGRALLSQPSLLLLDEPFSSVDCSKRKQIISYLLKINYHFNIPMLIISHHLEDILKLTHQIVLIENGSVTANDYVFNLIKNGETPNLINPKKYQNTLFGSFDSFDKNDSVFTLLTANKSQIKVSNQSKLLSKDIVKGTKIQLCIKPDDIALSLEYSEEISLQNQIMDLLVEVSQVTREKLLLHKGQSVYCLINAKYLDIVHVYNGVFELSNAYSTNTNQKRLITTN